MQRWSPEEFAPNAPGAAFAPLGGVPDQPGAGGFRAEFRAAGADDPLARLTGAERDLVRGRLAGEVEAALRQRDGDQLRRREEEMQALLDGLAASLEAEAQAGLESVARAAADLALAVAARIVRREVEADPEVLTRALEDVLLRLRAGASLTLTTHPDDAAWLEGQPELLARLRVAAVQPDRRLARGGCLVVADRREWDATIAGQLAALSESVEAALANAAPTGGGPVVARPALS